MLANCNAVNNDYTLGLSSAMLANLNDEDAVDDNTHEDAVDDSTLYYLDEDPKTLWTEDDAVEFNLRLTELQTRAASRFWSVRKLNAYTCRVELVGEASEYSVPSKADPVIELKTLEQCFRRIYHIGTKGIYNHYTYAKTSAVSSTVLDVHLEHKDHIFPEIFAETKRVCQGYGMLVKEQMHQVKLARIQRRIRNKLRGHPEITPLQRALGELARKIQALEAQTAEFSAKLQFGKVLNEMERKNFGHVLAQIALAQREAKATKLGFERVFHEMKKRDFARLLEEIAVAKRDAKAAELTKRLQLLQMEAHRAGIALGTLDMPMVITITQVIAGTGVVSQCFDDIPIATLISKE